MKSTSLRLEVGQDRRQVLRLFEHRAGGLAQVDAELVGDDVRERRLAEAGRAEQQHVVQRLAALLRRADEDLELLARLGLADVFGEALRPQRAFDRLFVGRGGRGATTRRAAAGGVGAKSSVWMLMRRAHFASALSASLMPSLTLDVRRQRLQRRRAPRGRCSRARPAPAGCRPARRLATLAGARDRVAELALELEQQPLGGLLADARHLDQAAGLLQADRLRQLVDRSGPTGSTARCAGRRRRS